MKICAEQLWALNNVKKRAKTDDQTNGLQEFLPGEYRSAFGERNFLSGNFFYEGSRNFIESWNLLAAWGGRTGWGKDSGIDGHMTTDQAKNLWSRFGECAIQSNHMDNHETSGADRKDIRGWSCGCPCWYCEHQP